MKPDDLLVDDNSNARPRKGFVARKPGQKYFLPYPFLAFVTIKMFSLTAVAYSSVYATAVNGNLRTLEVMKRDNSALCWK